MFIGLIKFIMGYLKTMLFAIEYKPSFQVFFSKTKFLK